MNSAFSPSDAPRRTSRVTRRTDRAHLRAGFRQGFQYGRSLYRTSAPQTRRAVHRNGARHGLLHAGSFRRRHSLTMFRSLRSRLILASLLWTAGLLMLMHMLSLLIMHVLPRVRGSHATGPIVAALVLMAAGLLGLRQGLTPFRRLRE